MKIIIQYSGGKDSQATLIWAVKKYGAKNVEAVFCDTKWENPITYQHIIDTTNDLKVKLITVTSSKYDGMIGLVEKKGRFPSSSARFCTEELKIKPFLHYLMQVKDNVLIHQGIRADESESRSKMEMECRYFKYYLEPYKLDKKGKPVFHTYLKKEVLDFVSEYDDSVIRPVFDWSAQEVINYIIDNGQKPNELYSKGFSRVGCFPCIMCNQHEVKQIQRFYPERIEEIIELEEKFNTSFFAPDYIPKRFCSKSSVAKKGKNKGNIVKYPTAKDVLKYINGKWATIDLFDPEEKVSCMSYYNLCE